MSTLPSAPTGSYLRLSRAVTPPMTPINTVNGTAVPNSTTVTRARNFSSLRAGSMMLLRRARLWLSVQATTDIPIVRTQSSVWL